MWILVLGLLQLFPSLLSANPLHALIVTVRDPDQPLPKLNHPLTLLQYPHRIYNRGLDDFPPDYHTAVELSNVGGECFIYFKHLYLHYHHLPQFTIFGNLSQFLPTQNCRDLPIIMTSKTGTLAKENDGFGFLGEGCGLDTTLDEKNTAPPGAQNEILELLGVNDLPKNSKYLKGSFFVVTKEAILRNPRSYYLGLSRRFGTAAFATKRMALMERLWPVVFQSNCLSTEPYHCVYRPEKV